MRRFAPSSGGRRGRAAAAGALLALLFALASAGSASALTVADWQMNEPFGAMTMFDDSGAGLNGSIGSAVETGFVFDGATGYRWTGQNMDGVRPERLVTVDSPALDPGTDPYAVTVRIKTGAGDQNIVQKGQAGVTFWKIDMLQGKPVCLFRGADGQRSIGWPETVWDHQWHTIRCERDANGVSISVDGGTPRRNNGVTGRITNDWVLSIGGKSYCDPSQNIGCDYFVGYMDYVKVERPGVADTTAPSVSSTSPADGATDVTVGGNVAVTFSEAMDRAATEAAFSLLDSSANPVSGTFSWDTAGTIMTFDPATDLAGTSTYSATVSTGARDLAGNALGVAKAWSFTTVDTTAPTVLSVLPADGATGVAPADNVVVTFSEAMDRPATEGAFSLRPSGGLSVSGSFSWNAAGTEMTFDPAADLSGPYDAEVSTAARDLAGNALGAAHSWSFATLDATPPSVSSTVPADTATGVSVGGNVVVTFSEAMDRAATEAAFSLLDSSANPVSGSFSWNTAGTEMTFDPASDLAAASTYGAEVSTAARDLAGNALGAVHAWSFSTVETIPPTVASVSPADGAVEVPATQNVVVTFSEPMTRTSAESAFSLRKQGATTNLSGAFSWNAEGTVMTFNPSWHLRSNTVYEVRLSTGAADLDGNALASPFTSSFRIDATPPVVSGVNPADGETGVQATRNVVVTFSEPMNKSSAQAAFSLRKQGTTTNLSGAFSWNSTGTVMTFNPSANFGADTVYEVRVATTAKDLATNALATAFASSFRSDATPPTVTKVDPANGATSVPRWKNVVITFSEPMNRTSAQSAFSLIKRGTTTKLSGAFSWNAASTVMTFNPSSNLLGKTLYDVLLATTAKDLAGNALAAPFASSFGTA